MSAETIEMVTGPDTGEADTDALTPVETSDTAVVTEEATPDADKDTDKDAKLKAKLTPEAQKAFDKRIAREVSKTHEAQAKAEAATSELSELRKRVDAEDAEAVLAAAREAGVMPEIISPLSPKGWQTSTTPRLMPKRWGASCGRMPVKRWRLTVRSIPALKWSMRKRPGKTRPKRWQNVLAVWNPRPGKKVLRFGGSG